ncbi:MAG: septal ring lytic transglycosylase RlpA family protein [Parvularcula sp.]|jgi:rare lipoprotein A|nr:septal ring lytic transglycosylase RlpA family protein [Parvularcula sp.]
MGSFIQRIVAFGVLVLMAACASTPGPMTERTTPRPHVKVGQPYQVKGVWYVPKAEPGYDKTGYASWYGPGFHGRLTANGELFDENRLTAAHPTLPLPSIVEVTNPRNGKRLQLRVNDRGPFANDRILDLSKEAARQLGTMEQGVAPVRVRYLGPARIEQAIVAVGERERGQSLALLDLPAPSEPLPDPILPTETDIILADLDVGSLEGVRVEPIGSFSPAPTARPAASGFFVQVGAYSTPTNASMAASRLPEDVPVALATTERAGRALHVVRLGPFLHAFSANEALETAKSFGFLDAMIVEEALN